MPDNDEDDDQRFIRAVGFVSLLVLLLIEIVNPKTMLMLVLVLIPSSCTERESSGRRPIL